MSDHDPLPRGRGRDLRDCVYIVGWPDHALIKVGYSGDWRCRTGRYSSRGAVIYSLTFFDSPGVAFGAEGVAATVTAHAGTAAFDSRDVATPFLGGKGSGWTECFRIDSDKHQDVVAMVERSIR